MIGHNRPSEVLNELYDILEAYQINLDTYDNDAFPAIKEYLKNDIKIPFQAYFYPWDNGLGGIWNVAFVENGFPFLLTFEMIY